MSKFNTCQQKAINTKLDENVLISAGAGSGKTATLTEKVVQLIEKDHLKPSELLVLTFTKNAAHQMQERIISAFKEKPEIANELASAHIQTFDSFAQEIVKKYSAKLNIPDSINVANETVIKAKQQTLLDEIFNEYYEDDSKRAELVNFLKKYNLRDDESSKNVILDVATQLDKFIPNKRQQFINLAKNDTYERDCFNKYFHEYIDYYRKQIIESIYKTYFYKANAVAIAEKDLDKIAASFLTNTLFNQDYVSFSFSNEILDKQYRLIVELLSLNDEDFIKRINDIRALKYVEIFPEKSVSYPKEFKKDENNFEIAKQFHKIFMTTSAIIYPLVKIATSLDEEYKKFVSTKNDVKLIIDIVEELRKRLDNYKHLSNCYTYSDIANMALILMTDNRYQDVSEEVRSSFRYIMIDEYQDTNDLQEEVINSLTRVNKQGKQAHLFTVGDAKQSIYAFRNSNLKLFIDRRDQYSANTTGNVVIPMNLNYRSRKEVINDINYIFSYYMRLDHGGITYLDRTESLEYGDVDYKLDNPEFGVVRLIPDCHLPKSAYAHKMWEIDAIIADIKKKIDSHFKVYDRYLGVMRDCRYSDFLILMRVKSGFKQYEQKFVEAGIPLNNTLNTNLSDIDAIIVIESLTSLIAAHMHYSDKKYAPEINLEHLFASVARSYLYQYSDEQIFRVIRDKKIEEDPIMEDIKSFIDLYEGLPFHQIYLEMITHFKIIEKLYLIGDADDNIAKIESLYSIVLSEENSGEGILDFIKLFKDISKYELDLSSESIVNVDDAVNMMTIHAAKGLENKIVYLPCSYNYIGGGSGFDKIDYTFTKNMGILLPLYVLDANKPDGVSYKLLPTLVSDLSGNQEDVDEHVRLYYVALTRAENLICIVGEPGEDTKKESDKETLYAMLYHLPHYEAIDDAFITDKMHDDIVDKDVYLNYLKNVRIIQTIKKSFTRADFKDETSFDAYSSCWNDYYYLLTKELIDEAVDKIDYQLACYYYQKYVDEKSTDLDFKARLFMAYHFNIDCKDLGDAISCVNEYEGDKDTPFFFTNHITPEVSTTKIISNTNLKFEIIRFGKKLAGLDSLYFVGELPSSDKDKEKYKHLTLICLLRSLMFAFDKRYSSHHLSFKNDGYRDQFNYVHIERSKMDAGGFSLNDLPVIKIDNQDIAFPVRLHQRASVSGINDEELPPADVLERGTYLHSLMELVDFNSKDTSFIPNKDDRALIDKVLTNPFFDKLEGAQVHREYTYHDEVLGSTGSIDLFFVKDGEYYIVDYKSKHTENDGYLIQLHTYQRNIMNLYHLNDAKKIHLYLLSIMDNKLIPVDCEE